MAVRRPVVREERVSLASTRGTRASPRRCRGLETHPRMSACVANRAVSKLVVSTSSAASFTMRSRGGADAASRSTPPPRAVGASHKGFNSRGVLRFAGRTGDHRDDLRRAIDAAKAWRFERRESFTSCPRLRGRLAGRHRRTVGYRARLEVNVLIVTVASSSTRLIPA